MVHLVMRSRALAQRELIAAVTAGVVAGRCRVFPDARVLAMSESKAGVDATVGTDECAERIIVDRINVLAGYEPNTTFIADVFPAELRAAMRFDARGYLVVDPAGHTGAPGIYAAGDVCNPGFPSVVSAIAQGALAARTIEVDETR
jgi:thioredoxin reductase